MNFDINHIFTFSITLIMSFLNIMKRNTDKCDTTFIDKHIVYKLYKITCVLFLKEMAICWKQVFENFSALAKRQRNLVEVKNIDITPRKQIEN